MAHHVSINKCDSYDDQIVRKAIEASFAPLGGLESIIANAGRVLLKLWCAHRSAVARLGSLAVILVRVS